MTKKKLFAITMALLLAVTIPLAVLAETYDLSKGNITVDAKEDGQYVSQDGGVQNEKQTTDTIIIQDKTESETTSNTITINAEKDTTADVTLSGVNIDVSDTGDEDADISGEAAISTGGEGNVTIELDGKNTLKSGLDRAGLEKNNGGNLTIGDENNDGALTAVGGTAGAGIGGGTNGSVSDIIITGGDVTATSGSGGAGIGGGNMGSGSNINITGGNVTATGNGWGGAGIGGGAGCKGSDITIEGGNITAIGGDDGAGIGGGWNGNGTDITVSGDAQVKVSVGRKTDAFGSNPAGIGGGTCKNGEVTPDTSKLGENGSISYFAPGADKSQDTPERLLHKKGDNVETHTVTSVKNTTAATCTQPGSVIYQCSCGEEITQSISPLGHDREYHKGKAATCTEAGWEEYYTCKREDCTYTTYQKIDALNHSFTHYVYQDDATCLEDGTEIAACDHTGCTETDERTVKGTAKGHSFTHYVYQDDATCLEDGTEIATCDHAGCTETDERTAVGTATGHSFTNYVYQDDATCLEDGTEIAACDHAGCTETDERTAKGTAMGHSFTNYVYQNDATCLDDGTEVAACDHAGCTETDERTAVGTATGHSFTDYVSNKDATYTQDGTETAECDHGCGETDTRTVEGSKLPLYRVTDEDGKSVIHKANYSGNTLTITAELDGAILTGSTLALPVLQARGITTIVFVTGGTTSTFELADLLAKGEGTYALTHAGENVTFTLESADITEILKAE